MSNYQQQSALDTLAEVSRHHLDYSSQRRLSDAGHDLLIPGITDQQFIAQLREFNAPPEAPPTIETSIPLEDRPTSTGQDFPHSTNVQVGTSAATVASGLAQTASAANQQLEAVQAHDFPYEDHTNFVDPGLHNMGGPVQVQSMYEAGQPPDAPWVSATNGHSYDLAPQTCRAPTYGFGFPQKPVQKKIRGRFDDSRRKEVAGVRKSGACIRCRMLKKSCSGEVPCRTCRNVATARLWKGTCFRARVADEFTLWSSGLFRSLANTQASTTVRERHEIELPGRLEARLHNVSNFSMSFAVREYRREVDSSASPSVGTESSDNGQGFLLSEDDSLPDKVDAYATLLAEIFIDSEPSMFVRKTLQLALSLAKAEDARRAAKTDHVPGNSPSRTCYNLQERLIHNAIQLWVLSSILKTPQKQSWELQYRPDQEPQQQPEHAEWPDERTGVDPGVQSIDQQSAGHRLITGQLLAAVETRCSRLSKVVMNELERRLLQRLQADPFATYISSVLLLSCVERMTGLFRSFDASETKAVLGAPNGEHLSQLPTNAMVSAERNAIVDTSDSWPLETPTSTLWSQGPRFADLLTMLLRIRGLPPKTGMTANGTLTVMPDCPASIPGRPAKEPDEQAKIAATWLESMQLSVDELMNKRDGQLPATSDGLAGWDMIFTSKILLPEKAG